MRNASPSSATKGMKATIITEDSQTTAETSQDVKVKEYFKGAFLSVRTLEEKLSSFCDTQIVVYSEEYGYLRGNDLMDKRGNQETPNQLLVQEINSSDVVVILLSTAVFEDVIADRWSDLTDSVGSEDIWCLGVSQGALNSIDVDVLEENECDVFIYRKVGVARISNEVRDELLGAVERKSG